MSGSDQEKLGVKLHARPSLGTNSAIPIKKRRLIFSRSPSPPPETQSSVDCGTTHNKSFSLAQVPSLEASDIRTCVAASSGEGSSFESGFKILVNGGISEAPKHQHPSEHECTEKLQSMASVVEEENRLKVIVSDDKLVSLKGIEQHSVPAGHVDVPMEEEILDAKNFSCQTSAVARFSGSTELQCKEAFEKVHISESHSVRKAQFELQDPSSRKDKYVQDPQKICVISVPCTASAQSSLDRSNWDLNTTMDTWEESMSDSALNHKGDGCNRSGFGGLIGRVPQPNLTGTSETNKKPNASPPMLGEPRSLSSDHFPSLCTSPKSGGVYHNSETEACLDLRLKPSFMSESCFTYGTPSTLGNFDSLKETQFLSLSTMPSSSSADPKSSLCGVVKPERYHECIQIEERKTEITGPEAFGLKPIKSEPCEIGEASRITISAVVNSASDAIKLEPVEDKSQDCVAAKETRLSHKSANDHNLLQSDKAHMEAVGTNITVSHNKSDSFIKDVIMQIRGEYPHPHEYEMDSMSRVMQNEILSNDKICHRTMSAAASISQSEKEICCEPKSLVMEPFVNEGRELISIKHSTNEGNENADFLIKCQIEGQIMRLVNEACEQPHIAAESLCESFNSGTLVERVVDEKAEIDSHMSLIETDTKTATLVETYADINQVMNQSICMMEEQGDNECKTGSPHVMDGGICAVHEKVGIDYHGYEDGEVKDGALHGANGDSHLRGEIKKVEGSCPRGIIDVAVAMPSTHELVKHSIIESSEMSKDLETVECSNNIDPSLVADLQDPAMVADLQESSSVTGDSNRMKTSKTIRKTPRDSLKKDKFSERKTKSDRDPTVRVVSIENKADGSGIMENAGGRAKSSVPLSASEAIKDAFDRGSTGRIINLNSASSRKMKPIHERPLSSRVKRDNPADILFNREKSHSHHSRDENPFEKSHKTENEERSGLAFGNHGSGSMHTRVRGGSGSSHLRFRDKPRLNQFGDRNCDPNYMREQINDHNDFRYSRAINSAEVSRASGPDASAPCAGRISRKVTNELQSRAHMACRRHSPRGPEQIPVMRHPNSEVNHSRCMQRDAPDLVYVSQEKMNRQVPGEMLDPLGAHPHSQFERTDRIPAHRERLSLSPVHRRGPPQLTPLCSPRSQAMSPSHWSPHSTSEGFNGQPEMIQCRTGTPIAMQESMRSTRQHYAEEILARRRRSAYGARLSDGMMEVISSREHDFPRSGRDFPRKIRRLDMNDPRHVPGEYYRTPFGHGPIHELAIDDECAVGRRFNEVNVPARYRQHCIAGDDVENFSFHCEEGPPRSYRYHAEGNQGFNEGGNSREFEGRFKNRLGNTSRRYRHIEEQQQQRHEDGFRHQDGQGWNDSGFNNIRPKRRRC